MFWYDGTLIADDAPAGVDRPLDTVGLRFGASVFTTLRVYSDSLAHPMTQWQAHCDRLHSSITQFDWRTPDWPLIYEGAQQLKAHYAVLRITCFPDGKVWITGRDLPTQLSEQQSTGISAWLASADYARSLPAHKTGNYLACWLSRQQAQKQGAQEAVLTNTAGNWLETATGNLWGWAAGQWWTPVSHKAGNQCLPGIMRDKLIDFLAKKGEKVNLQPWTPSVVASFDAIAYSNCVVQLLPIHTIFDAGTTLEYDSQHASLKALQQLIISNTEVSNDS